MKKVFFVLKLIFVSAITSAQSDVPSGYASMITADQLKKHLTIIASDEMEGRETGTEGQRKAATYIESQFRAIGLKPARGLNGYQQYYPLYQDSLVSSELKVNDVDGKYGTDYIIPVRVNKSGEFKGKAFVFAGYGIEDKNYNDYLSANVKDKIVVIFLGEPKLDGKYMVSGTDQVSQWTNPGVSKKLELATLKGAAGVLFINPMQETFSESNVAYSRKSGVFYPVPDTQKLVNYALISHVYAKNFLGPSIDSLIQYVKANKSFQLTQLFEKKSKVKFDLKKHRNTIQASNVIGILEGTDKKDEYVYLTAHYDHLGKRNGIIYNGADDDGSGTVSIIQMAEAFVKAKSEGKGPRRTIIFMTVSGEENGLWGSEYYSDNPLYPLELTTVDLNIDMIGRIDTERTSADTMNYVYVIGHNKLSSDLPVINEGINNRYTQLTLDYKFDDPADKEQIYFRSDHYNFARKGVPILFFYDGMLKADYHKPEDDIEKITWPLFEKRVRMIFHTAWEIANRESMLKRDLALPPLKN